MTKTTTVLKQVRKFEKELGELIDKHKHLHAGLLVASCISIATGIALNCAPTKDDALKVINDVISEAVKRHQEE